MDSYTFVLLYSTVFELRVLILIAGRYLEGDNMKHLFIINPIAGKGKSLDYIPVIEKYFSDNGSDYFIEVTKYPGHATELVREYVSKDNFRVYSVGGDGTLNEVLNGIAGSNSSLAIMPAGSGNDFVKSLENYKKYTRGGKKLPEPSIPFLDSLVHGNEITIDIGKVNGRYFLNISSVGFDAEVVYKSYKIKKLPLITGLTAYILSVLATLASYKNNHLEINIDGKTIKAGTLLVAVANGRYYGGGMQVVPSSRLDDGFLDICLIEYVGRSKIIKFFSRFVKGTHGTIKEVSFHKAKKVSIISKNSIAMNIDGEASMISGKIDFEIIPGGIKVVLPR